MIDPPDLATIHDDALTQAGLFDAYGRCMLRAQDMEETVKVLHGYVASDKKLNELDFDDAIARWVSRPAGGLIDALKLESGLEGQVRELFKIRHYLAHRFFPDTLTGMSTGTVDVAEEAAQLQAVRERFRTTTAQLQDLVDKAEAAVLDDEALAEIESMVLDLLSADDDEGA